MNWISRTSAGVTSRSSAVPVTSAAHWPAYRSGIGRITTANVKITHRNTCRPFIVAPPTRPQSLRSVRIEERPALPFIGDMGGQYQAQFGQRLEFPQLSLHENSGNRAYIASKVGFYRDDACRVRRLGGRNGFSLDRLRRCRLGWGARPAEPRSGALTPSRQEFGTVFRVGHMPCEQLIQCPQIARVSDRPLHGDRRHRTDESRQVALGFPQQFGAERRLVRDGLRGIGGGWWRLPRQGRHRVGNGLRERRRVGVTLRGIECDRFANYVLHGLGDSRV